RVLEESKPNYIFHLAASASVADSVQNPSNDFNRNNFGTARLLEAVRLWGGDCRIVLASSGAVYGEPSNLPIRETDPLNPISPYGANKASTEMNARAYAHSYGLDIVTARLFNTYGPRMVRFVLLDFIRKLQKNADRLEVLGTGQQVRDFSYVDDVCEGLLLLGDAGESGEAYHVASGHSVTVQELAERLIKQLGLHSRLVFTGTSWAGDAQQWVVDIEKIRGLGYAPQVDLDEGIAQTVAWFEKGFGPINRK
ncbi:MAG: GDP-mannose 4,6-dehydratase, partial [Candidatus Promineifilaceae bacterium]